MDQLDKKILLDLSINCRVSFSTLSRKYNVALNTIKYRIKKMKEEGVIKDFVVLLNPKIFNANSAIITFNFHSNTDMKVFQTIGYHPNVIAIGKGPNSGIIYSLYCSHFELNTLCEKLYNFEFETVMSDNGPEFKGSLEREHPFETMCNELGIKHLCTRPYRPQTNGKIEAFFKILKNEFFYPNTFESKEDLVW